MKMENELDPRLQQMLNAYGTTPERDPEFARRNQERFVAILNMIIVEETTPKPAVGGSAPSAWTSSFNHLKETFAISIRRRSILFMITSLIILAAFLFGGVGITAYAASSSLPGDALYPLKTTIENARVNLTADPANQARLYMYFAGRRLSEIQSLISEARYTDIVQAASEFESDIQKALSAVESLSQTDPAQAVALNAEIAAVLRGYSNILTQMLASIPGDIQPVIQSAINDAQSAASLLNANDDDDFNDDEDDDTPTPDISKTPQVTVTPDSSPNASETPQMTVTPDSLPIASETPQAPVPPAPSATQAGNGGGPVIQGGDGTCQGFLGAVTVENLEVPQGASCTLDGTRVQGNIFVRNGASLTAQRVTVIGNIQADGASVVEVLAGSTVGGSIQIKQGGAARVEDAILNGDIQLESNNDLLSAMRNQVGGSIQVFKNTGGVTVADNTINGNMQCKENNSAPAGGNNVVQGNKEDQCAGL